jgi:hypothetical protein
MASASLVSAAGSVAFDRFASAGVSNDNEVTALLMSLNLQKYVDAFVANDIDDISTLNEMQDTHFRMLGVSLGHQLKIQKQIKIESEARSKTQPDATTGVSVSSDVDRNEPGMLESKSQRTEIAQSKIVDTSFAEKSNFSNSSINSGQVSEFEYFKYRKFVVFSFLPFYSHLFMNL